MIPFRYRFLPFGNKSLPLILVAFCICVFVTGFVASKCFIPFREASCDICGHGDDVRWLISEAEQVLEFQRDHTVKGFPLTGWGVEDGRTLNAISGPRFVQFWNLSTLSGGGGALEYMKEVMDAFFSESRNGGFPWFYDVERREMKKDRSLPAYVVGDVLMGLSHIYEMTGEERFRQRAERMGRDSIVLFLDEENNLLFNIINSNLEPRREVDSEIGHVCLLIDGWLSLYDVFGDETYLYAAERAVDGIWSLRDEKTGLIPEVFNAGNGTKGDWMGVGTGGELMETLYYLWYLTGDDQYVSRIEKLADAQIEYFWDDSLDRFVDRVRVSDGVVLDPSYEAIRLESNVYSLVRLYSINKKSRYLDYAERSLVTYMNHGFLNGVPVVSIDGRNKISSRTVNPGTTYPFLKAAAMLSKFRGEKYLDEALGVAKKSVSLFKKSYGYAAAVDPETGRVITDNLDIGGVMWFQNEGLAVLASLLMVSPQWDGIVLGRTSVVAVAENSLIRGIKVDLEDQSYKLDVSGLSFRDPICFNFPGGAELEDVRAEGLPFLKDGSCAVPKTLRKMPEAVPITVYFKKNQL